MKSTYNGHVDKNSIAFGYLTQTGYIPSSIVDPKLGKKIPHTIRNGYCEVELLVIGTRTKVYNNGYIDINMEIIHPDNIISSISKGFFFILSERNDPKIYIQRILRSSNNNLIGDDQPIGILIDDNIISTHLPPRTTNEEFSRYIDTIRISIIEYSGLRELPTDDWQYQSSENRIYLGYIDTINEIGCGIYKSITELPIRYNYK
jgi:hypothetical protein